jgi:hypothetical protein
MPVRRSRKKCVSKKITKRSYKKRNKSLKKKRTFKRKTKKRINKKKSIKGGSFEAKNIFEVDVDITFNGPHIPYDHPQTVKGKIILNNQGDIELEDNFKIPVGGDFEPIITWQINEDLNASNNDFEESEHYNLKNNYIKYEFGDIGNDEQTDVYTHTSTIELKFDIKEFIRLKNKHFKKSKKKPK